MDFDPFSSMGAAAPPAAAARAMDPFAEFRLSVQQPAGAVAGLGFGVQKPSTTPPTGDPFAQFAMKTPPVAPVHRNASDPFGSHAPHPSLAPKLPFAPQPQAAPFNQFGDQAFAPTPPLPSSAAPFDPFGNSTPPKLAAAPAAASVIAKAATAMAYDQSFDPFASVSASATEAAVDLFADTAAAPPPPTAANSAPPSAAGAPAGASLWDLADVALPANHKNMILPIEYLERTRRPG